MFHDVLKCRCCESEKLTHYLNLGDQPLANSYHHGEELPVFPLRVNYCQDCWHSQLSCVVDPAIMFKHYLYVSGTSATFRNHCRAIAQDAFLRLGKSNPKVLDIACNDGTLLSYFQELGCHIHGIDPAENLREITKDKGIPVTVGFWGKDTDLNKKFDIITATNVLAHVDDPFGFLEACDKHLEDTGTVILEFPYCKSMLENAEFDTIYHEHLSYFLASPFAHLVERTKLFIADILLTPIHGGSVRFFLKKGLTGHGANALKLIEGEKNLLKQETFIEFARRNEVQKATLHKLLGELKDKRVVGYGASAKGNTMLNAFGVDLDYIVDDNPMKWGYLTPGRNIEIRDPNVLKDEDEPYILLLAWNFAAEIKSNVMKIRDNRSCYFIKYVPEVLLEAS